MPCTTWTCEDFSLADVEGEPAGFCNVALQITYGRDGSYVIDGAGFVQSWAPVKYLNGRPMTIGVDQIVWFQSPNDLERIIIARALSRHGTELDQYIGELCYDDERVWG
jgi:hypothetical protein